MGIWVLKESQYLEEKEKWDDILKGPNNIQIIDDEGKTVRQLTGNYDVLNEMLDFEGTEEEFEEKFGKLDEDA